MASEKPILCNLPVNYDLIREKKLGIAKRFANGKEYAEEITKFRQLTSEEYGEYCQRLKECAQEYDYQILTNKIERILKRQLIVQNDKFVLKRSEIVKQKSNFDENNVCIGSK